MQAPGAGSRHDTANMPGAADFPAERPSAISLGTAFWYWLRLGFLSFGGPTGQIALMHTDLVENKRWISERRFLHALNYCMVLPGPEAMQLATYIGWLMHRTAGGIMAGMLFMLPSLLILILLSWIYLAFGDLPVVAGVLYGVKPAVVAIVLAAAVRIGSRSLRNRWLQLSATMTRRRLRTRHSAGRVCCVLLSSALRWRRCRWRCWCWPSASTIRWLRWAGSLPRLRC